LNDVRFASATNPVIQGASPLDVSALLPLLRLPWLLLPPRRPSGDNSDRSQQQLHDQVPAAVPTHLHA